jgi:hypothetical protein
MNKDKREIPTTNNLSEDADGDEWNLLYYGDPIANRNSSPPREYALEDVGLSLDYGDPTTNTQSPPPPSL